MSHEGNDQIIDNKRDNLRITLTHKMTYAAIELGIGVVQEIVFDVGKDPNNGDLPAYVAVEIFSYNPPPSVPPFDINNPKVCMIII